MLVDFAKAPGVVVVDAAADVERTGRKMSQIG